MKVILRLNLSLASDIREKFRMNICYGEEEGGGDRERDSLGEGMISRDAKREAKRVEAKGKTEREKA